MCAVNVSTRWRGEHRRVAYEAYDVVFKGDQEDTRSGARIMSASDMEERIWRVIYMSERTV